jgi:hypothetical protein
VKRKSAIILLAAVPSPLAAHEAFGDLGPFYQGLLHPFADPAQGLVLAAVAVCLARQPVSTMRVAYLALVLAGVAGLLLANLSVMPVPTLRVLTLAALAFAALTFLPRQPGRVVISLISLVAGLLAALSVAGGGAAGDILSFLGAAAGIAVIPLFLWGAADAANRRVFPHASLVAASWIGTVALLAAVVPA